MASFARMGNGGAKYDSREVVGKADELETRPAPTSAGFLFCRKTPYFCTSIQQKAIKMELQELNEKLKNDGYKTALPIGSKFVYVTGRGNSYFKARKRGAETILNELISRGYTATYQKAYDGYYDFMVTGVKKSETKKESCSSAAKKLRTEKSKEAAREMRCKCSPLPKCKGGLSGIGYLFN